MDPKDEFIALQNKRNDKISFALNEHGHVTHIVKRVDVSLYDVFSRLRQIRCVNLPIIIDIVKHDDFLEVQEEYVRGRTVERVRQEQGTLDDRTLLSIATDVCRALTAIHGAQPPIIHRDIKPENIMERENGDYVLIDFDAARVYREDAQTDTKCIATVGYAAPEQYGLSQTDVRSDLFSLGATLYELKTGEAYHVNAKCDGLLGGIIAKCTAFEPGKRFQSAQQLLKRLEALQPGKKRRVGIERICIAVLSCTTLLAALFAVYFGTAQKNAPAAEAAIPPVPAETVSAPVPTVSTDIAHNETVAECICQFYDGVLTTDKGLIIPFDGETPVTVQLMAEGSFNRVNCLATNHIDEVSLVACRIDKISVGARADITETGRMTIYNEGVYCVNGFASAGGNATGILDAVLLVTRAPEAYTECACVLNAEKTYPIFKSNTQTIPTDGSPLYLDMRRVPYYEDRLCTASAHKQYIEMLAYVEEAPEGAICGVTDDNRFYTDTPGVYELRTPYYFDGVIYNSGCRITVIGADTNG